MVSPIEPVVVAFLQNMWFKDVARMKKLLKEPFKNDREKFIATWLFFNCRTGKNLRKAFTEEVCEKIVWEEQSPEMGDHPSSKFPPDYAHIRAVLEKHNPHHVLAFGAPATAALSAILKDNPVALTTGPHPTARIPDCQQRLAAMALRLKLWVFDPATTPRYVQRYDFPL